MLVAGSIYEACKLYELFSKTPLAGKCAIVTSYAPSIADIKGEESGEGETDNIAKYNIYRQMLADWFDEPADAASGEVEVFEKAVKKKFIDEPGQMKLLIVERLALALRDERGEQERHPLIVLRVDRRLVDDEAADVVLDRLGRGLLFLADRLGEHLHRVDAAIDQDLYQREVETFSLSSARMYVSIRWRIAGSYILRSMASPLRGRSPVTRRSP
jgi:hypothetical protein